MESLWNADYQGGAFELFGGPHLAVLVLVGVTSVALILWGRRTTLRCRRIVRLILAVVLIVNELLWHVWALAQDLYTADQMLPLHLCSALVWLSAYAFLRNDRRLYGVMYFLGVAGAMQALITPDAGPYGFPHFRFMQTEISHGLLFLAGVYVVAVEGYRPTIRSVWRLFIGLNLYALVVGLVNVVVGSNYLFVNGKPETPSIIDYMPAWPWYLLYLEVIAVGLFTLLYLPFVRRRSSAPVSEPEVAAGHPGLPSFRSD